MKASELRINPSDLRLGNWVMYDNRYFQVSIIAECFPELNTTEFGIGVVDYNNIQPIPLTEEVLLKCCKSYEFFHDGVMIYKFGAFNAYKQNRIWLADSLGGFGKEYKHINYLHQLQNLYYALTGEELEVSL